MSDESNPFDDLNESIEDQDADDSADNESTAATSTASTSTAATDDSSDDGTDEPMTTGEQLPEDGKTADPYLTKAFEFGDEATQFPFYVREDTLDAWEVVDDVEVTPALVQDGVKDVTTSEKHDAMLQMVLDRPDLLVEYIKEARGIPDADTSDFRDES
ncbi:MULTISPECIES: hypothetical protein [Halobacterium]|uniref:hypothetical protein n=1 Tax=Halobacterium TaxID=2239 RepID=UPI00073EDABA|nr:MULTISPECIES: hypothetical protein [Halobacterium]MCG1004932.1 hypothetical protein [Halobacterium noricense]